MLHDALSHIRPFITPMPTFHSNELIYFTAVHCNFALNYTWGVGGGGGTAAPDTLCQTTRVRGLNRKERNSEDDLGQFLF